MSPAKGAEVDTLEKRPHEGMLQRLKSQVAIEGSIDGGRGFELASKALDKIATADSLDAIFDANAAASLPDMKDFIGQPFTPIEVAFNKSAEQYKGGVGAYAYISAALDDGTLMECTCGAPNVVGSLYRMQELGVLQSRIVIKAKPTPNGQLYQLLRP